MATAQQALTPLADQTPAVVEVSGIEPSGSQWVARYPTSTDVRDLESPFREGVERFINALELAGAQVSIAATYRPPERAFLMHWAWKIVKQGYDPRSVPTYAGGGVNIKWDHESASGGYDATASVTAARAMVVGYGIMGLNVAPALNSRHIQGIAIDMSISWSGTLSISRSNGEMVNISSSPRSGMNHDLHAVGSTYGVIKYVGGNSDKPHWSNDGH